MKTSLLKTSFTITLLGILLLLFISTLEPKLSNISDITTKKINKKIKIQAEINKIRIYNTSSKNQLQILEVSDQSGKTEVLLSNPKNKFSKNQRITIIGKITPYKDTLQIQTEKIILHTS